MTLNASNASISTIARSPELATDAVECVVTVPTFKRPEQLLETLASLKTQVTNRAFAVVVIENEADARAGANAAAPLFESGDMRGLVIVAHERGNCSAYNAGWQTALITFPNFTRLLVIDDDEIATPDWLEGMCLTASRLCADIVGGPQIPVFTRAEHAHWASHPVFSPPYEETGRVPILYSSGNLMISRDVLQAMPAPFLDVKFNFIGGGDSDFLNRAKQKGFRLAWCTEAAVKEAVPERRVEAGWIRARSLRNGVISTLVEKKQRASQPLGKMRVLAKSLALLALSPVRGAYRLFSTRSPAAAIYPVHVGLGRVLAEFGYANEQYRQPDKN